MQQPGAYAVYRSDKASSGMVIAAFNGTTQKASRVAIQKVREKLRCLNE